MPALRNLRPFVLLLACLILGQPVATLAVPSDLALKAALLFKLPRFTYLPHLEKRTTLDLCILGHDPFGNLMHGLSQMPIEGRSIQVHNPARADDAWHCNLVFVPNDAGTRSTLEETIHALSRFPVLTVSDIPGFAQANGMVELASLPEGNGRLRIVINQSAAARQGIKFNAQLLRLATLLP